MKISTAITMVALCISAAVVAGCSRSAMPPNAMQASRAAPGTATLSETGLPLQATSVRRLLYLSDATSPQLDVYDYQTRTLLGTVTGVASPYGECVDGSGNVYVAQFVGGVVEFAHGGSKPIKQFNTDGYTMGCSVDKRGDVAAGIFQTQSGGQGDVEVFPHGGGTPERFTSNDCYFDWPPGYDDKGNLFVEGLNGSTPHVCELRAGSSVLRTLTTRVPLGYPGSVMWDGKYIALTDQNYQKSNHTAIEGVVEDRGVLDAVNIAILNGACVSGFSAVMQPFLVGLRNTPNNTVVADAVVGGDAWCNRFASGTDIWYYPAGGNPRRVLANSTFANGAALSIAPR